MRISDWSSDVCSSDLRDDRGAEQRVDDGELGDEAGQRRQARQQQRTEDEAAAQDRDRPRNDDAGLVLILLEHAGIFIVEHRFEDTRGLVLLLYIAPDRLADEIQQIGRESCRERVCQYVVLSVVAVSLKK